MFYQQYPLQTTNTTSTNGFRQQQSILTISGEGSIQAQPNIAIISLGARTENKQANIAQSENAAIISSLIQSLQHLGISPNDIQTSDYQIDMQYDYEDGKQLFRGYQVVQLLEVTLQKIKQTGIIIDTAVNHGANIVTNIRFTVAHQDAYYNQALALALKNAQKKARVVADTLKVTLNEIPMNITETSQIAPPRPYEVAAFAKSAETPIMPGQIQITAHLEAQFGYFN